MEIDFNNIEAKIVKFDKNDKQVRAVYEEAFPINEKVDFEQLFSGIFKDFVLYGFFCDKKLVGFAHFLNHNDFIHLNYLAVRKGYRSQGIGSYIIKWLQKTFNNKAIVADIENLDEKAENKEQRFKRLKFYYKNGFKDGKVEFDWEGTRMYYIHTNKISKDSFLTHIIKCFPTIENIKKHKSNKRLLKNYYAKI